MVRLLFEKTPVIRKYEREKGIAEPLVFRPNGTFWGDKCYAFMSNYIMHL